MEELQMNFKIIHNCINVFDLEKSQTFYEEALGMTEVRRLTDDEGSYILSFIANKSSEHQIELTWLRDRTKPYNLGDNEMHIGFRTDDYEAAYEKHKAMGCICFENKSMGIYFISDPDGYWLEIIPTR